MPFMKTLNIVLSVLFINACSGGSGTGSSRSIDEVFTDIFHYHPSYFEKYGEYDEATIEYSFLFKASASDTIERLYLEDTANDRYYDVIDLNYGLLPGRFYDEYYDAFYLTAYSSVSPHRVNLNGWQAVMHDASGSTERPFNFTYPVNANEYSYVYGSEYINVTSAGIPAMEAMTTQDNSLSFTKDNTTNTLNIEFLTTDIRADDFVLWLYNSDTKPLFLAQLNQLNNKSIANALVRPNTLTSISIPLSEIASLGVNISEIYGIHLVLYNKPINIKYSDDNSWITFLGVSEYLTL